MVVNTYGIPMNSYQGIVICISHTSSVDLRTSERWWRRVCSVLVLVLFAFPLPSDCSAPRFSAVPQCKAFGCLKVSDGETDAKSPCFLLQILLLYPKYKKTCICPIKKDVHTSLSVHCKLNKNLEKIKLHQYFPSFLLCLSMYN